MSNGAAELKALRERHGLTLKDVSHAIGVNESTLCRWERGRKPHHRFYGIWVEELEKLIAALPTAATGSSTTPTER